MSKYSCITCGKEYSQKCHLRNLHYSKNPSHAPDVWDRCQSCGEPFERLGQHWKSSDCNYPHISDEQWETLTGILMGDGSIGHVRRDKTPYFVLRMKNREYLDFLNQEVFPLLFTGVTEHEDGVYSVSSYSHESMEKFKSWYDPDKRFPNIDLTPTILKHWLVCDGHTEIKGNYYRVCIGLTNERKNKQKIVKMFDGIGIREYRWDDTLQENGYRRTVIEFPKETSKKFFNFIGGPVPGFEYKWPNHVQTDEHWSHQKTIRNEITNEGKS